MESINNLKPDISKQEPGGNDQITGSNLPTPELIPKTHNAKLRTSDSPLQTPDSQQPSDLEMERPENRPSGSRASRSRAKTSGTGVPKRFYEDALDEEVAADFAVARGIDSIDDEIALLKVRIKLLLKKEPGNHRLFLQSLEILAKLVKAKYGTHKKEDKKLGEAIQNIIRDIGVPLGVAALNKKL